jgi:ubiquitin C-terminal hydrolase
MNAVIQCIANAGIELEEEGANAEITVEFIRLLQSMWRDPKKTVSPLNFKYLLGRLCPVLYDGEEQQDAHEFFVKTIEFLNGVQLKNQPYTFGETFGGQMEHSIKCIECGRLSTHKEVFNCISLPIPQKGKSEISLKDCFELFLKEEKLKFWCEICQKETSAVKKIKLDQLPSKLVIQLQRFNPEDNSKNLRRVNFPLRLTASEMSAGPVTSYRLFAVANHYGKLNAGHYTAYCSNSQAKWYKYDDHTVTALALKDLVSPEAYILFYS